MRTTRQYFYVVFLLALIFSFAAARTKSKAKPHPPIADILFSNDWESVSTFDSRYVQNVNVAKQRGEMRLILTAEEQQRLAEMADLLNFWRMPPYLVGNRNASPNPGKQTLRIKTENRDKTILWAGVLMNPKFAIPINRIVGVLDSIVRSRPEYKKLPPPINRSEDQLTPAPVNAPIPLSPQ